MRFALPIMLAMGGLSLCLALTGAITAYLLAVGQPLHGLAFPAAHSTLAEFSGVFAAAAWFSIIWGSLCAAAFFYAHHQLRRAADAALMHSL